MSFKALVDDSVELLVDVPSDFGDGVIPRGTRGIVVERYERRQRSGNRHPGHAGRAAGRAGP